MWAYIVSRKPPRAHKARLSSKKKRREEERDRGSSGEHSLVGPAGVTGCHPFSGRRHESPELRVREEADGMGSRGAALTFALHQRGGNPGGDRSRTARVYTRRASA